MKSVVVPFIAAVASGASLMDTALAATNAIAALKPTDEETDVLYDLFEMYKGDDDRMDIDEFQLLMEEYGVNTNDSDGVCSRDTCNRCIMEPVCTTSKCSSGGRLTICIPKTTCVNTPTEDLSGGWCQHYNAYGADVGGVDGLTAV